MLDILSRKFYNLRCGDLFIRTKLSKYLLILFFLICPIHSDNASNYIENSVDSFNEIYRMQLEVSQETMPLPQHSILGAIIAQKEEPVGQIENGYCTGLVRYYRDVPWTGNAETWLEKALDADFATGNIPRKNAIMVEDVKHPYGHVAYVLEITEDSFTVIEQNVTGFGIVTKRILPLDWNVIGFIY